MSLLERIAASNGDPDRTIKALRLINDRLIRERNLAWSLAEIESVLLEPSQIHKARATSDLKKLLTQ